MLKTVSTISGSVSPTFTGDVTLSNGNLVIGTSGKGIDFSATAGTGTSELLNDYEEGTWTPVLVGVTSAGTGTYSMQQGVYTKVGNLVTVAGFLQWSAHTGTGELRINGLPFTANSSAIDTAQAACLFASDFNAGTSATALFGITESGGTSIILRGYVNAATRTNTPMNTSGDMRFSFSYRAA